MSSSASFGNKSSALSFNQKVLLLLDMKALSAEGKKKFQKFMEIRNQFIHNIDCRTFMDCCKFVDGLEPFLITRYSGGIKYRSEKQLFRMFENLMDDLYSMFDELQNNLAIRKGDEIQKYVSLAFENTFIKKFNGEFKGVLVKIGSMSNEDFDQFIKDAENKGEFVASHILDACKIDNDYAGSGTVQPFKDNGTNTVLRNY